jgi:hypothetical protein
MRHALLVSLILAAAAAAGCAALQAAETPSTEEFLSAAGFQTEAVDTPEKLADLQTLPARQLLPQTRDGKTFYVYLDPSVCHCLYVGGEPEYRRYQDLRLRSLSPLAGRARGGASGSGGSDGPLLSTENGFSGSNGGGVTTGPGAPGTVPR